MKKVIIYPGRFQPMLPHHAEVYNRLKSQFAGAEVYDTSMILLSKKTQFGLTPSELDKLNR